MSMRDEIKPLEQPYIGDLVRLEIPLQSVTNLRRVAEVLRGLAYQLDSIGRFHQGGPVEAMLDVRSIVKKANKDLTKIRSRGRPKKSRNTY